MGAFLDNHFLDHRYPEEENAGYTAIEAIDRPLTGAQGQSDIYLALSTSDYKS